VALESSHQHRLEQAALAAVAPHSLSTLQRASMLRIWISRSKIRSSAVWQPAQLAASRALAGTTAFDSNKCWSALASDLQTAAAALVILRPSSLLRPRLLDNNNCPKLRWFGRAGGAGAVALGAAFDAACFALLRGGLGGRGTVIGTAKARAGAALPLRRRCSRCEAHARIPCCPSCWRSTGARHETRGRAERCRQLFGHAEGLLRAQTYTQVRHALRFDCLHRPRARRAIGDMLRCTEHLHNCKLHFDPHSPAAG